MIVVEDKEEANEEEACLSLKRRRNVIPTFKSDFVYASTDVNSSVVLNSSYAEIDTSSPTLPSKAKTQPSTTPKPNIEATNIILISEQPKENIINVSSRSETDSSNVTTYIFY